MEACPTCNGTGLIPTRRPETTAKPLPLPPPQMRLVPNGVALEEYIGHVLEDIVKEFGFGGTVLRTSKSPHSGDVLYTSSDGRTRVLIDTKESADTVPESQYAKLLRDMKHTDSRLGILITSKAKVSLGNGKPVEGDALTGGNVFIISAVESDPAHARRLLTLICLLAENADVGKTVEIPYDVRLFFMLCPLLEKAKNAAAALSSQLDSIWSQVQTEVLRGAKRAKTVATDLRPLKQQRRRE